MKVSLTPDMERLVSDKVKAGLYPTPSEVLREGLLLLQKRDEDLASLRGEIEAGFEAIRRGEYEDYDARSTRTLAADIKNRGRARLAAKTAKTNRR
jgi:antitoxin ParD1/3/4